jgi:hypothetical protein
MRNILCMTWFYELQLDEQGKLTPGDLMNWCGKKPRRQRPDEYCGMYVGM